MTTSQNGWPAVEAYGAPTLHSWVIPARNGTVKVSMRYGSAGLILAHFALWYAETVEPLAGKVYDDWGYAPRNVRGSSDVSNHASGTAIDLNATQHPLGKRGTLTLKEKALLRTRLAFYSGTLRHGAFYTGRVDEMHLEINAPLAKCEKVAKRLLKTPRGKRLLKANPGQDKIIYS